MNTRRNNMLRKALDEMRVPLSMDTNHAKHSEKENDLNNYKIPLEQTQKHAARPLHTVPRMISRAHHYFNLRFQTLFLSYQLDRSLQRLPYDRVLVGFVALFLAMKIEEIYPPSLKEMACYFKIELDPIEYTVMEYEALRLLSYQPSVPTALSLLSDCLPEMTNLARLHLFYVLELFYTDCAEGPTLQELCSGAMFLRSPFGISLTPLDQYRAVKWPLVERCCRKIFFLRSAAAVRAPLINRKYQSSKYEGVADRPLYQ